MERIDITPIRIAEHYEMIAVMMRGLHENEKLLHDKTAKWDEIEESYMRHVMEMQDECDGLCLVAYAEGVPVGFIFGYLEEQDDSRIEEYTGKELYVSDGYVDAGYRRRGTYGLLNRRLEAHYIEMGIKRIIRYTLSKNDKMQHFLEKEGYGRTRLVYEKWL